MDTKTDSVKNFINEQVKKLERIRLEEDKDKKTHIPIITISMEPGSGGKESAENTVRNLAGWRVRVDRPTGDKAQRADGYSVQVNNNNVYLLKGMWNRDYIEELRFFSLENSKFKDQVDASSGAFKFVAKPVFKAGGWKL